MKVSAFFLSLSLLPVVVLAAGQPSPATGQHAFSAVQPELFDASGAQSVAWADYDNDGDLDLAVTFKNRPNRLYQNRDGIFVDVAQQVGWHRDISDARVLAWGDYDGDGHLDLYLGYGKDTAIRNRLYRNLGDGKKFKDVAPELGLDLIGTTRQSSWLDYDGDGDLDLFVAMRDRRNYLFAQQDGTFTNVAKKVGVADPRRTVGATWFDFDNDNDLDLFVANQNGDRDGFYRNDSGVFVDIAQQLNIDQPRRAVTDGSVGAAVCDYDKDGDLDLFVATYSANKMYINDGNGKFTDSASKMKVAGDYHGVAAECGDFNNDGWDDIYITGYWSSILGYRDYLYQNSLADQGHFTEVLPANIAKRDGDHGVRFADYDNDGDLDLALASNHQQGHHQLFRNDGKIANNIRILKVSVQAKGSAHQLIGAVVRVYQAGTDKLLGTKMVDTGGGYNSQNVQPLHFAIDYRGKVDIRVTTMNKAVPALMTNTDLSAEKIHRITLVL